MQTFSPLGVTTTREIRKRGGRAHKKMWIKWITMSTHSSFQRINRIDIPEIWWSAIWIIQKIAQFHSTVPAVGKGANSPVIELPSHWIKFHPSKYFHAQPVVSQNIELIFVLIELHMSVKFPLSVSHLNWAKLPSITQEDSGSNRTRNSKVVDNKTFGCNRRN